MLNNPRMPVNRPNQLLAISDGSPTLRFQARVGGPCVCQNFPSNLSNSASSRHCNRAFSLLRRKWLQESETEFRSASLSAHATFRPPSHKLAPGRKLCSRLAFAMRFKSEYPRPCSNAAFMYSCVMSERDTPLSNDARATGTLFFRYAASG